jgi:hypothetical protein
MLGDENRRRYRRNKKTKTRVREIGEPGIVKDYAAADADLRYSMKITPTNIARAGVTRAKIPQSSERWAAMLVWEAVV